MKKKCFFYFLLQMFFCVQSLPYNKKNKMIVFCVHVFLFIFPILVEGQHIISLYIHLQ